MLNGIVEHEGRKTELSNAIVFYEIDYFFYCFVLIHFYWTIW